MRWQPLFAGIACLALLASCSSDKGPTSGGGHRVMVEVHNTGSRPVVVTLKSGKETSIATPIAPREFVTDDLDGAEGEAVTVTVTAPITGGAPATSGSGTCIPKASIIDGTFPGLIYVSAPPTGTGVTITCVGSSDWN